MPFEKSTFSIERFTDEVSSSSPAPGGGSVSALAGSLGAALMSMVSNLTYNKKGYEKTKFLPSLKAFINGAYTGNNEKFDFAKNNQKWFGSSLFGLSLDIPLFSSFSKKVNSQKAKISMQQAETKLNETQYRIRMEIETALNDYQLAIENYFTEKENLGLAERIENKNQLKYFEGMVGSFELRQAQLQLYSSQSKYLGSIKNLIERKINLEILINSPKPNIVTNNITA